LKTSWLFFACLHVPLQDKDFIDWLIEEIKRRKPDVIIHGGDGHEADSASRWPSEYDWTLSDEFREHNEILKRIRKANPGSRRVFLPGNHDDNILALNRIDWKLRDLCDYRDHEPELKNWEQPAKYIYDRERGVFRIGQVTFAHGYESGVSADEYQAYQLGLPYGLFVSGHTHRPVPVTQAQRTKAIKLPFWYANAGCGRDMVNVPYMLRRRRFDWGQGIVVGEADSWRYDSALMPQKPLWEAETLIYKMYGE
jgi:predicted phosphodiesterase